MSAHSDAALASSRGPHRERNEDRCAAVRFRFGTARPDIRLGVLCDGMGGMARGGEAASTAIAAFIAAFATVEPDCSLDDRLSRSCDFANRAVFDGFRGEAGTTLTAVAIGYRSAFAIHVGDSRLYGVDSSRHVSLFTQDDTVSGAVNAHLGQDDEDDLDNRLLQFVGIGGNIDPHMLTLRDHANVVSWLITSDGAHSIGKRAISGVCQGSKGPYDLVRKLVYVSEAIDTQDNASAICINMSQYGPLSDDQHEGLTLQVSAPDKGLEIWIPESSFQVTRQSAPARSIREETRPSRASESAGKELPKAARSRVRRTVAKKKKKQDQPETDAGLDQQSMDVIFDIGGHDD